MNLLREHNMGLIKSARLLADSRLKQRADHYDQTKSFPAESFRDLFEAGFLGNLISSEYGGHGMGHHKGDILSHWMIVKELAKADMSLARCFEGHSNAMLLIDNIGNEAQKNQWFKSVLEKGEIWTAWSGEPQDPKPGQQLKFGTYTTPTPDGYTVDGSKVFCSSAPGADWAILFVSTKGPGGARHTSSPNDLIMLACNLKDPSVSLDDSWWDPIGMKGSVSYLVKFDQTFIPKENLIGYPGQYLLEDWQTRLTPQYSATFLGGAEAAYDYALAYIKKQRTERDPYVQHRIAKMSLHIETGNMWLEKTAKLWESGNNQEAKISGNSARYLIEQLAMETVNHAVHICGARSMIRPSELERVYRDLSFYVRHDNDDQVLAMIGRALLGESHDVSFFNSTKESNDKKNNLNGTSPNNNISSEP